MTEIPLGYCRCGCGQRTTIPTRTNRPLGRIKGRPMQYISGHNSYRVPPTNPQIRPGDSVLHATAEWSWKISLCRHDDTVRAFALVDKEDFSYVGFRRWHLSAGYAARWLGDNLIFLHRELMNAPNDREVDHKNGDILDNRRSNLRLVTRGQQAQNQRNRSGSTSRYRGVSWDAERGLWRANAMIRGRGYALGRFASEDEAGRVAADFRRRYMPFSVEGR